MFNGPENSANNFVSARHEGYQSADDHRIFPKFYGWLALVFLIAAAIVTALIVYVVMAKAKIVVMAEQQTIKVDQVVDVVSQAEDDDKMVAGMILQASGNVERNFPATDSVQVEDYAEVMVRISSSLSYPQVLIEKTRLLNPDGVQFRITERVTVPGNGHVDVLARADDFGAKGETGMTTFEIPGLRESTRKYFTAETLDEPTGGVREEGQLTQADVDAAVETLKAELEEKLSIELRQLAGNIEPESGQIIEMTVLDQKTDHEVGESVGEFDLQLSGKAIGVFFDRQEVLDTVLAKLRQDVPPEREIRGVEGDTLSLSLEKVDLIGKQASVRVGTEATAAITAAAESLSPSRLVGIRVDAAKKYLESVDGVTSASVTMSPVWSKKLPKVEENIEVEVR